MGIAAADRVLTYVVTLPCHQGSSEPRLFPFRDCCRAPLRARSRPAILGAFAYLGDAAVSRVRGGRGTAAVVVWYRKRKAGESPGSLAAWARPARPRPGLGPGRSARRAGAAGAHLRRRARGPGSWPGCCSPAPNCQLGRQRPQFARCIATSALVDHFELVPSSVLVCAAAVVGLTRAAGPTPPASGYIARRRRRDVGVDFQNRAFGSTSVQETLPFLGPVESSAWRSWASLLLTWPRRATAAAAAGIGLLALSAVGGEAEGLRTVVAIQGFRRRDLPDPQAWSGGCRPTAASGSRSRPALAQLWAGYMRPATRSTALAPVAGTTYPTAPRGARPTTSSPTAASPVQPTPGGAPVPEPELRALPDEAARCRPRRLDAPR